MTLCLFRYFYSALFRLFSFARRLFSKQTQLKKKITWNIVNNIKSERKVDFEISLMLVFSEGVMKSAGFWLRTKTTQFTQLPYDYLKLHSIFLKFLEFFLTAFAPRIYT